MDERIQRQLNGITFVLCLIAGFLSVLPFGLGFPFYVVVGPAFGVVLSIGVFLYASDAR